MQKNTKKVVSSAPNWFNVLQRTTQNINGQRVSRVTKKRRRMH